MITEPTPSLDERIVPRTESVIQVNIDATDPLRCVGIGADLPQQLKDELVQFLSQNVMTFAWSMEDMTGVAPDITCHELNVDSRSNRSNKNDANLVRNAQMPSMKRFRNCSKQDR